MPENVDEKLKAEIKKNILVDKRLQELKLESRIEFLEVNELPALRQDLAGLSNSLIQQILIILAFIALVVAALAFVLQYKPENYEYYAPLLEAGLLVFLVRMVWGMHIFTNKQKILRHSILAHDDYLRELIIERDKLGLPVRKITRGQVFASAGLNSAFFALIACVCALIVVLVVSVS